MTFDVAAEEGVTVEGKPFSTAQWKQIDNPVIQSDWGSPVMHIQTEQGQDTLDFSDAQRIMAEPY